VFVKATVKTPFFTVVILCRVCRMHPPSRARCAETQAASASAATATPRRGRPVLFIGALSIADTVGDSACVAIAVLTALPWFRTLTPHDALGDVY